MCLLTLDTLSSNLAVSLAQIIEKITSNHAEYMLFYLGSMAQKATNIFYCYQIGYKKYHKFLCPPYKRVCVTVCVRACVRVCVCVCVCLY